MRADGKTVLVTGASGTVGKQIVRKFLGEGAHVIAHCFRHTEKLNDLSAEKRESHQKLLVLSADLTNQHDVRKMMSVTEKEFGQLDILVNNAGGARPRPLLELDAEEWTSCIELNLTAPFLCTKEAVPLLEKCRGTIVNISSVAGLTGGAFGPHYASVKSGMVGLTKSTARELGPLGIRVNCIAPGPVESPMTDSLDPQVMDAILKATALGRVVQPEEVADAVFWLSTADAITGQTLVIDGGRFFH
ncbi:3-oxoacyl-ACP reductase FabG [Brevibacillus ruminantium]|uniref:3-oxoacyl-ACP reductase FabG n=1 Tax=Brevibacillus ruminantium TaxID=2950604 RepID=A0ABY4WBQ6_9BACL|nr:3-oxoacyl-ACP reductase family protein [Brevibacillus ruminantium]USG64605.1 3-oxoacyl-ACP reductase FabG [Brevibacillus ruminantium]